MEASYCGYTKIVEYLLEEGADIEATDYVGIKSLCGSAAEGWRVVTDRVHCLGVVIVCRKVGPR